METGSEMENETHMETGSAIETETQMETGSEIEKNMIAQYEMHLRQYHWQS